MKNFAIIKSADAPNNISTKELYACTEHILSSLSKTSLATPPILVMHVSESVAAIVGVGSTGVIRHNHSDAAGLSSYYEVWLVGQAGIANYVLALQGILDDIQAFSAPPELEMLT
ncbi:MAG TPA: hypothetical protein VGK22_00225 [Candidatus Angelobacter sp.]